MCFQTFLSCKLFLTVRSHKRSKNLRAWWKMTRPDTLFSYQTPRVHQRFSFNGAWNSIMQIMSVSFETKQIIFSEVLRWTLRFSRPALNYVRALAELQFSRGMFDRIRRLTQNDSRLKIWWRYDSQFIGFLSVTFLHQKEMLFSPWKKSHFQNYTWHCQNARRLHVIIFAFCSFIHSRKWNRQSWKHISSRIRPQ